MAEQDLADYKRAQQQKAERAGAARDQLGSARSTTLNKQGGNR